jgi:Fe-S cluster assembly ATPase SufC
MPEITQTPPRIVVLSTKTLFAAGIVAHLRQNLAQPGLQTLDAQQPEVLEQLVALQPSILILDATDAGVSDRGLLDGLLRALPALTVLRLDPQQGHLQVVTSRQRTITQISDLVTVIDSLTQPTLASAHLSDVNPEPKEDAV